MPKCRSCREAVWLHEYEAYWCSFHKQPVRSTEVCDDWHDRDDEVKMQYRITSVESKREKINPWHDEVRGRQCNILCLERGAMCYLLVDMAYDPGCPHRFRTSPVIEIRGEPGKLTIETWNTVYVLERIDYGTE